MTIVSTTPDTDALTLIVVNDLAAPPERVWQLWSDPRQLERWWGPPTYPATFATHDFVVGGSAEYFMNGPDGDKSHGWWTFRAIDEPRSIELEDGFADAEGNHQGDGMRMQVVFTEIASGTRMTLTTTFADAEQMKQLVDMGMVEGMTLAQGQIEGVLAA